MKLVRTIRPDWDVPANVLAMVSTREGGVSNAPFSSLNLAQHVSDDSVAVNANRQLLAASVPECEQWQFLQQTHSTDVVQIHSVSEPPLADAMFTTVSGIVCAVLTADCLPLFIAAVDGSEIAAVHAGWRGLANGIVEKTVSRLKTKPQDLVAWMGPAIGACHFEVGEDVLEYFLNPEEENPTTNSLDETRRLTEYFKPAAAQDKYLADLYGIAKHKLHGIGLERVSGGDHCTYCEEESFYSYRRDGATGRMASCICLLP